MNKIKQTLKKLKSIFQKQNRFGFTELTIPGFMRKDIFHATILNVNLIGLHTQANIDPNTHPHRQIEQNAISDCKDIIGLNSKYLGYTCSGASEGLIFGAWYSRKRFEFEKVFSKHIIITSKNSHVAIRKALSVCGLDGNEMWELPFEGQCKFLEEKLKQTHCKKTFYSYFLTWCNPTTLRSDDITEISSLVESLKNEATFVIDAAYGGLAEPVFHGSTLQSQKLDVITMDYYKMFPAPIGTAVTLLHPRVTDFVGIDEPYYPHSQDNTISGSRNFSAALSVYKINKLILSGFFQRKYKPHKKRFTYFVTELAPFVEKSRFPIAILRLPTSCKTPAFIESLIEFDIYPTLDINSFSFRVCFRPDQSYIQTKKLVKLIAKQMNYQRRS